jgi:hypothetical protein
VVRTRRKMWADILPLTTGEADVAVRSQDADNTQFLFDAESMEKFENTLNALRSRPIVRVGHQPSSGGKWSPSPPANNWRGRGGHPGGRGRGSHGGGFPRTYGRQSGNLDRAPPSKSLQEN